jgi:hypothetical protein
MGAPRAIKRKTPFVAMIGSPRWRAHDAHRAVILSLLVMPAKAGIQATL